MGEEEGEAGRSCYRHLGRDRPLALELQLVPLECLLPAALEVLAVVMFRHTVLEEEKESEPPGCKRDDVLRTVPQNSERQCGHCPTRRRAAELQRESDSWNWQRFLAGMVGWVLCNLKGGCAL